MGAGWIAYSLVTLVILSICFASSRRHDSRPATDKLALAMARQTFWGVVELDLLLLPWWSLLVLIELVVLRLATLVSATSLPLPSYIVAIGSVPIALAIAATLAMRSLGMARLSLSTDTPRQAAVFGWQIVARRPLDGATVLLMSFGALFMSLLPSLIVGAWLLLASETDPLRWVQRALWVLVTTIGLYFATGYVLDLWLDFYHAHAGTRHHPQARKKAPSVALGASLVAAAVLMIIGGLNH